MHIIIFILLIHTVSFCAAIPDTKEIFSAISSFNNAHTPPFFMAQITSAFIDAQLKNIPKEKINYGSTPSVYLVFQKGRDVRIWVDNVDDYYRFSFSIFEDILHKSGLFMGINTYSTYPSFIRQYQIFWIKGDELHPVKIKVVEKGALKGDYGIYFFSELWQLTGSEYYENNQLTAVLKLKYVQNGGKEHIQSIILDFKYKLKEYTINLQVGKYQNVIPDGIF